MIELCKTITEYLSAHTDLVVATNLFYYEMPETPDECVCVYEDKSIIETPPQIDVEVQRLRIGVRAASNTRAAEIANICHRWLYTDDANYEVDYETSETTGFIQLNDDVCIYVSLAGRPVWDKVDQQGRKYFTFAATITSNRR